MNYDKAYLQSLIAGRIEENSSLEYKSAASFGKSDTDRDAITLNVSALANSGGGVIIYGIAEFKTKEMRHLPEAIDPIDQRAFPREWVDQRLSLIQPKIAGIKIHPIHVGPELWHYVYIIDVPQGETAHQATDRKYYRRRNFEVTAMEDYEIRETMNRRKNPDIKVRIMFSEGQSGKVSIAVENDSEVMARHYSVTFSLPLIAHGAYIQPEGATLRGDDEISWWHLIVSPQDSLPLFPKSIRYFYIPYTRFNGFVGGNPGTIGDIKAVVYADEMKFKVFEISMAIAEEEWAGK